jgi:hypothetical protein
MFAAHLALVILYVILAISYLSGGDYTRSIIYTLIGCIHVYVLLKNDAYIKDLFIELRKQQSQQTQQTQ